ncbi:MAG: HAD family hydrolase [Gammaproteobacteria bacterium]
MKNISVICFDLDDTFWDLAPVIPKAEQALYEWYASHYPRVTELYTIENIRKLREAMPGSFPELAHDLTALRMKALQVIAGNASYPESMAEEAFLVFDEVRNNVELYADVVPGLKRLGKSFRLVTLSNGNADLNVIGIDKYFETSFSARQLGYAKPDAMIFQCLCEQMEVSPQSVAHVGDHPENDIFAASQAGMRTIWVNREGGAWTLKHSSPDHTVGCIEELADFFESQARTA